MSELVVTLENVGGVPVLKLIGEARMHVEALERQTLKLMAQRPKWVVVDLSELTFMSTLTMGSLVQLYKTLKANGGKVCLAGASQRISEVLAHARLNTLFEMNADVAAAISAVPAGE